MRIATFLHNGRQSVGTVENEAVLDLAAALGGSAAPTSMHELIAGGDAVLDRVREALASAKKSQDKNLWRPLAECRLAAPIPRPTKNVFCVGRNYKLHIEEGARARGQQPTYPPVPEFFSKPPTAVIGHEDEVRVAARITQQLDYEVELAIVIGKTCRDVKKSEAAGVVFGYTVLNDVTARDLQRAHGQWFKGKGLDTSCPIGPWIVTADEFGPPSGKRITLRVNGETRQDSNSSDMLFDCDTIIESLSAGLTLEPGDIICTGTPSGVGFGMEPQSFLQEGDVMEAEVEGIGVLRNTVRRPA
jgi:2-keto-4-pentenoate hydratase/2-oxohepta-3-ene-1,7-dioic acid hydratase in catechol pathway